MRITKGMRRNHVLAIMQKTRAPALRMFDKIRRGFLPTLSASLPQIGDEKAPNKPKAALKPPKTVIDAPKPSTKGCQITKSMP